MQEYHGRLPCLPEEGPRHQRPGVSSHIQVVPEVPDGPVRGPTLSFVEVEDGDIRY